MTPKHQRRKVKMNAIKALSCNNAIASGMEPPHPNLGFRGLAGLRITQMRSSLVTTRKMRIRNVMMP